MKREGMSPKHVREVAKLPCLITGRTDGTVVSHHLLRTGEHGAGRKSSDRWVVPLTHAQHAALHASGDETGFFTQHGIDPIAVATDLWGARDSLYGMGLVIHRARANAIMRTLGV